MTLALFILCAFFFCIPVMAVVEVRMDVANISPTPTPEEKNSASGTKKTAGQKKKKSRKKKRLTPTPTPAPTVTPLPTPTPTPIPVTDDGRPFIRNENKDYYGYWLDLVIDPVILGEVSGNTQALGDSGRLFIPDVGINVSVWYAFEYDQKYAQALCDAYDTAVYTPHEDGEPYIADHWSQGFEGIKYCREGTVAFWKHADRIDTFRCVGICLGANDGNYIYTDQGKNCFYMNEGGFFMYTCNEDWLHVTVTFWQPFLTFWFAD